MSPSATIEVPQDHAAIVDAIAAANVDDTIVITDSGTYVEGTLTFTKALSLIAAPGEYPTVVSDGSTVILFLGEGANGTRIGSNDGGRITFDADSLARDMIRLATASTDSVEFENINLINPLPSTSGVALLAFGTAGNVAGVGSVTFRDVNVDMNGVGGRAFRLATTASTSHYTFERVDVRNVSDSQDPFILGVNASAIQGGTLNVIDSQFRGGVRSIYIFENASQPKWTINVADSLFQTRSVAGAVGIRIDLPDTHIAVSGSAIVSSGTCIFFSGDTRPVGDHGSTLEIDRSDLVNAGGSSNPTILIEPPSTSAGNRTMTITNSILHSTASANNVAVTAMGSEDDFSGSHNNAFPGGYINYVSSNDVSPPEAPLYNNFAQGDFRYANVTFTTASNINGPIGSNRNFHDEGDDDDDLLLAFPGAYGFGRYAQGGRGGDVYTVSNLADSGEGSLRHAISSATGPRTIVFAVSGTIDLQDRLRIQGKSHLTIAGQTSPRGITIRNYDLLINNSSDIVVRFIRSRLGDDKEFDGDATWVLNSQNVIIDHCSFSWSTDEVLSLTHTVDNITVQNCIISEALVEPFPGVQAPHSMAMLVANISDGGVTIHRNLLAHNDRRNPRVGGAQDNPGLRLDFVNNVVYDWGQYAGNGGLEGERTRINHVGNLMIAGPSTVSTQRSTALIGFSNDIRIFQQGNLIDSNVDGQLDPINTGWNMFANIFTPESERFNFPQVPTVDPLVAYEKILERAGASHWRDDVDLRVVEQVRNQTGGLIDRPADVGGYPQIEDVPPPLDSDGDGMPDWWEELHDLDPHDPEDRNGDLNGDGYTNLETYLNCLADPDCIALSGSESWTIF